MVTTTTTTAAAAAAAAAAFKYTIKIEAGLMSGEIEIEINDGAICKTVAVKNDRAAWQKLHNIEKAFPGSVAVAFTDEDRAVTTTAWLSSAPYQFRKRILR